MIGPNDKRGEPTPLDDRGLGVMREMRGNLEADEAIRAVRLVIDRAQDVAGAADVRNGDFVPDLLDRLAGRSRRFDLAVIIASRNGFGESRRV